MGKVIAIANQKGGVGKTTTAINLSSCIATAEVNVLLIDFDAQANCTSGMGLDPTDIKNSIYEVITGKIPIKETIVKTSIKNLDFIPSSKNLAGATVELVYLEDREKILKRKIEGLKNKYDFIFIDCPPALDLLTVNALTASDSVIIPVQCEYFALEGLTELLKTIERVRMSLNRNLEIEGVLLTMYDDRTNLSQQVKEEIKHFFKEKTYETVIPRNVRLAEAPSFGKPIILYDIKSKGASSYINLAREILKNEKEKGLR